MTSDSQLSLARVDTDRLEQLWRLLSAMPAKARVGEADFPPGSEALVASLEPVLGQPAWLVVALLEAVLAERGSFAKTVTNAGPTIEYKIERQYPASPELVWSGDLRSPTARMTRWVIEDLFRSASQQVLIAGYSFDGAKDLFDPLFDRAGKLAAEGLPLPHVRVILDCSRVKADWPNVDAEAIAREAGERFIKTCWTRPGLPAEFLYYAPSTVREKPWKPGPAFAPNSMHAKCVVVDRSIALVGSANFSSRARNNRDNVEVGALIRDHHFIQSLLAAWEAIGEQLVVLPDVLATRVT